MKLQWLNEWKRSQETVLLVGDIGGTNTNLALAVAQGSQIELLVKIVFESARVKDFMDCVRETLDALKQKWPDIAVTKCCLSGAGPVSNNVCRMTNQSWTIDGNAIQKAFGFPTQVINDFTAISFGLPLLDVNDPAQISVLRRPNGNSPFPKGDLRAVLGPGTGLGVGFITQQGNLWRAFASEGGHMDLADFDEDTRDFKAWLTKAIGVVPEYEMAISGMGIKNLFHFFYERGDFDKLDPVIQAIFVESDADKPALISQAAARHAGCRRIMETFVRLLARLSASVSCLLLPHAGLFLAGGITAKNLSFLSEDDLFIRTFEQHSNPNLKKVLHEIPVYVIHDYSISLYGAANAALSLMASP